MQSVLWRRFLVAVVLCGTMSFAEEGVPQIQAPVRIARVAWQREPEGSGALLPFPNYVGEDMILPSGRIFGTPLGLLVPNGQHGWRIVPETYDYAARPAGSWEGLVWVDAGELYGLDPRTFAVRERLPTIDGRCAVVERDAIWCLTGRVDVIYQAGFTGMPPRESWSALLECSRRGEERRRFSADGTTLRRCRRDTSIGRWSMPMPCGSA